MKFIAGLRVWGKGGTGKTPQVFPRIRGSANRRVDLHLPLIASIPGRRQGGGARKKKGGGGRQQVETLISGTSSQARRTLPAHFPAIGTGPAPPPTWNQGDPPCSFPLGHRAPGRGGRQARTVSGCLNSAFLNISQHFNILRPICSGPGYPTQCEDLHAGSGGVPSVTSNRDQSAWSVPHGGTPSGSASSLPT